MKYLRAIAFAALAGTTIVTATGCAVARDQQTVGAYVDDAAITTAVKAKLVEDKTVSAGAISVETLNGTVQLSGFAKTVAEKNKAESIARNTKHVREVRNRLKSRVKENVLNALVEASPIELPKALVAMEISRLVQSAQSDMKARGLDPKEMPFPQELFEGQAKRRVHLGLALAELVEANDLQAKPEQVKSLIEDMAQNYENPAEVVAWYYADKQRLANVESMALEDSVVDFVLGKAKVVEKATAFDELMGQQA